MIITKQKSFEEILDYLKGAKKIFIIGCAQCATKCQTGGEDQVKEMEGKLTKEGEIITGWKVLDPCCDYRIVRKELFANLAVKEANALLVMACGTGVQMIEKTISKPVYPALDTLFAGTIEHIGKYERVCRLCGDCILEKTGGLCPLARCPKGLLNGPCGGIIEGKCEVNPEEDCVWIQIYEKLQKSGNEKILLEYQLPLDHRIQKT